MGQLEPVDIALPPTKFFGTAHRPFWWGDVRGRKGLGVEQMQHSTECCQPCFDHKHKTQNYTRKYGETILAKCRASTYTVHQFSKLVYLHYVQNVVN